jgi:hypothetical protein
MRILSFALAILVIFSVISFCSADIKITNGSLKKDYIGGELISGNYKINISAQENKYFVSSLGGSISLIDFLNRSGYQKDKAYRCSPAGCKTGYALSQAESSKIVLLTSSESKTLGFGITNTGQNTITIDDLIFRVSSDLPASCVNQLSLDLLNDGTIDFYNNAYVNEVCNDKKYGCFSSSAGLSYAEIRDNILCEKINLITAPAYKVGANIKNMTGGGQAATLKISLFDAADAYLSSPLGVCALPTLSGAEQDVNCIINYSSRKQFDAYVCISSNSGSANYGIKSESDSNVCGKGGSAIMDYEIYAQELKYAPLNKSVNRNVFYQLNAPNDLIDIVKNYIDLSYGGICASGCAIPFSLSSAASSQNVLIDNVTFIYRAGGIIQSGGASQNQLYSLIASNFTVTSNGTLDLNLEKLGFVVPNVTGTRPLYITFDGQNVVGENIVITTGFDYDLLPKSVLIKRKTYFSLVGSNISSAQWDFGDGTTGTSNGAAIYHAYSNPGEFTVKVTAKGAGNVTNSLKNFKVVVGNPRDSASLTIQDYEGRIANVTAQINSKPTWIRDYLQSKLNLTDMNYSLTVIKTKFKNTVNDTDYLSIVNDLSNIDVPYSVSTSKTGSGIPLSIGFDGLNMKYALALLERTSDNGLKDAITIWMYDNYDSKADYDIITRYGDSGQTALASWYNIKLTPRVQGVESAYFIMDYPQNLIRFNGAYSDRATSDAEGTYIPTNSEQQTFEFIIPEGIELTKLGAYIIPVDGNNLKVTTEVGGEAEKPGFNWPKFLMWFGILLFLMLIVYVVLQEWYKKRYEVYLFKNPNDLYNVITFISNSRAIKLTDADIRKKLGGNKWTGEQVNYAFNKLDGKRTGMWEIPIFKFFENRKVAEEISKRNQENTPSEAKNTPNTKFIKRPQF